MGMPGDITTFIRCFPQIYFACHRRHVRNKPARRILSATQSSIVDHLDAAVPTFLHELARHLGVTPSTMSLNIDRLEKAGYVRRNRDRQDARRVELRLTETGNRLKQQQQAPDPDLVGALLKQLKPKDRASAMSGLELLANAAESASRSKWPDAGKK